MHEIIHIFEKSLHKNLIKTDSGLGKTDPFVVEAYAAFLQDKGRARKGSVQEHTIREVEKQILHWLQEEGYEVQDARAEKAKDSDFWAYDFLGKDSKLIVFRSQIAKLVIATTVPWPGFSEEDPKKYASIGVRASTEEQWENGLQMLKRSLTAIDCICAWNPSLKSCLDLSKILWYSDLSKDSFLEAISTVKQGTDIWEKIITPLLFPKVTNR